MFIVLSLYFISNNGKAVERVVFKGPNFVANIICKMIKYLNFNSYLLPPPPPPVIVNSNFHL
jgi:hypothetical protein